MFIIIIIIIIKTLFKEATQLGMPSLPYEPLSNVHIYTVTKQHKEFTNSYTNMFKHGIKHILWKKEYLHKYDMVFFT